MTGRCHICRETKDVSLCGGCGHWMCQDCRFKVRRLTAAVKHAIFGSKPGCCGPVQSEAKSA